MAGFTENISSGEDIVYRRVTTPGLWLPRWMSPANDEYITGPEPATPTLLTSIFNAANLPLKDFERVEINPLYEQEVWFPRLGYLAHFYARPNQSLSLSIASVGTGHVVTTPVKAENLNDLCSRYYEPCFTVDDGKVVLRNIDLFETSLAASASGTVDLTTTFALHPRVVDAPVLITNAYGDLSVFSPQTVEDASNILNVGFPGNYRIRYSCSTFSSLLLLSKLLTINGDTYDLTTIDIPNVLDNYAGLFGLTRRKGEDNLSLKERCQALSLSKRPEQQLSAILGKSTVVQWKTISSLSVPATGWTKPNFLDSTIYPQYRETPAQVGSSLVLTHTPLGPIQISRSGEVFDAYHYTVSGSTIIPLTDYFAAIPATSLLVSYRYRAFSIADSLSGVTISSNEINPTLFYGVVPTGVKIIDSEKNIDIFIWGKDNQTHSGVAVFD